MTRIHLLTTRSTRRAHSFAYPLYVFRQSIRRSGMEVQFFFDQAHPRLTECDVLGIVSDYFGIEQLLARPERVAYLLESWRRVVDGVLWLDVTDGTGTLFDGAFASVDIYAKKQLLRERPLYGRTYHEREFHLDYYYQNFGETITSFGEKARIVNQRGLCTDEIDKLRLSWNIGLGDYNTFWGRGRRVRPYVPLKRFATPVRVADAAGRPVDVSYRVGTHYTFAAVAFHRLSVRQHVAKVARRRPAADIRYQGKLPYRRYLEELARSRIAPSPFGWGEICWRDFEVLLCGGLLLKPDMEHLETWPTYFEKDVTYVAHRWDFSDLKEVLYDLLDHPERCAAMARAAQTRYLASLSDLGGDAFARQLARLVEATLASRRGGRPS